MNTNWMAWVLGAALAFAFVANAAGSGPRRRKLSVKEMIDAKILQLKDPHPTNRHDAALALGARQAHKAAPALTEALRDPHPAVREAAQFALCRIAATAGNESSAATMSPSATRCERSRR